MNLASIEFAVFAAVLLVVYYRIPGEHQWKLLLIASTLFYLRGGWEYFAFLLFTSLTSFFAIQKMERNKEEAEGKAAAKEKNRKILICCLVLNFGLLFFCKASLLIPGTFLSLGLPLGISFYMFQTTGYAIDVYRGTAKGEGDFLRFHLFVSYFPLLVQGPICRYGQLAPQLFEAHIYDGKNVSFGLQRMLWGYFKKLVVADRIAVAIGTLKGEEYTGVAFLMLTLFYAIQIYGDFTGGIDVTIGLAEALGIKLPENFIRPFFSKNIAEYWRRWHISLGAWMKDYIFYPISVSGPMRNLSKTARSKFGNFGKRLPVYVASVATWFVTGIWHGLSANFVVWGMLNCFVIVVSEELAPLYEKFHNRFHLKEKAWYGGFEIFRMFWLMNLIRACDLFPHVGEYFRRLGTLFTNFNFHILWDGTMMNLGLTGLDYMILGVAIVVMFLVSLSEEKKGSVREQLWQKPAAVRQVAFFALFVIVVLMGSYGIGYDASNFIYNQF